MAEKRKKYGLYDKDGNFLCYRMTKRIKNEKGEYDVLTAKSKKSVTDCRKVMEQKIQAYYRQKEEAKHKGVYPEMLFTDFADNWYELNIKNADISKRSKDDYKGYVYSNIIPYFKDYKLCDITEDDCQRFMNQYVGYSKPHVSKIRMTLRRIMRKAKKQKLISDNPAEDIVLPEVTQGKRRPITDEERKLVLETAKTHYAGTMFLTMLYCGLRPIEIRNLKWTDIDFENDVLTVTKSKQKPEKAGFCRYLRSSERRYLNTKSKDKTTNGCSCGTRTMNCQWTQMPSTMHGKVSITKWILQTVQRFTETKSSKAHSLRILNHTFSATPFAQIVRQQAYR